MPSEAEIEAQWRLLVEKDDRTSPEEYPDMVLITRDELRGAMAASCSEVETAFLRLCEVVGVPATAGAYLSAASAVRSEPVAWQWINGAGQLQFATFRPTKGEAPHGYTPLYTSPVQTREDGIREALGAVDRVANFGDYRRDELTADYGQPRFDMWQATRAAILALLSQPEPKGDKA